MPTIAELLARELDKPLRHVENVIALLDEGNTIPFIARYRKELHGGMDDTALRKLEDRLRYLRNLAKRREEVLAAIDGQGKLTDELTAAIENAATLAEVEDLYRPYKQKRRTRATVAREKGLAPLAELLLAQAADCPDPAEAAADYIDPEKGVETAADALQGANDIIAEVISDDAAIRKTLRGLPGVSYMIVNEAGASVYSAGQLAAEEFPDYDVNLRSAISIARRLQDPLAELVKIDPKSIGVGQYQHDMPQKRLDEALTGVVEDCVNAVGVDVNTASASLLTYVAGLNAATAKNIVAYRESNGVFPDRKKLLKVPKLGPKAFEQCAGFLRVPESKNVLDNTGVHPESYRAAEGLLALCGYTDDDVRRGAVAQLMQKVQAMGEAQVAEKLAVGVPTLRDVVKELVKPGRDLRDELPAPILRTDVLDMKDLKPGMVLTGTVRNVIDFGVFVDIGVHQDGLVHISQVCNRFIKHPSEVVSVGDIVKVVVLDVDEKKHRISLSMKQVKE